MVNTYKGLSNNLYLFGLHPFDFAVISLLLVLLWVFTYNPWFTGFALVFLYFILKRYRKTDINSRKILLRFVVSPRRIAVKSDDIKTYKLCLK